MTKRILFLFGLMALTTACGAPDATNAPRNTAAESSTTVSISPSDSTGRSQGDDCIPAPVAGAEAPGDPDRRIENVIEALTGERQTSDEDPVEDTIDDPNFGGVWGDFQGGIVVAVLDCSKVDANELARIAGGPAFLHLIEVPHTFQEVNAFRNGLFDELEILGVAGKIFIESTLTGRLIEVHVLDPDQLPDSFGAEIPVDAITIVKADELGGEE